MYRRQMEAGMHNESFDVQAQRQFNSSYKQDATVIE